MSCIVANGLDPSREIPFLDSAGQTFRFEREIFVIGPQHGGH